LCITGIVRVKKRIRWADGKTSKTEEKKRALGGLVRAATSKGQKKEWVKRIVSKREKRGG